MTKDSFVFYRSFFEAVKPLDDGDRLALYDAIVDFALNQNESKLKPIPTAMFSLIKPQLAANHRKYENGKNGGRGNTRGKAKQKQNKSKHEPNVNVNANVNVNGNVNNNAKEGKASKVDYDYFMTSWNNTMKGKLPTIAKITTSRQTAIRARLADEFNGNQENYLALLDKVAASDFLCGSTGFAASFDWVLKPSNIAKTMEGNYDNRINTSEPSVSEIWAKAASIDTGR